MFFSWRKQKLFENVTNNVPKGFLQNRNTVQDPDLTFLPYSRPVNWTIAHTYTVPVVTRVSVLVKKIIIVHSVKILMKQLQSPFPIEIFGTARYRTSTLPNLSIFGFGQVLK